MTLRIELPDDFEMKKDDEIIIRFHSKAGQYGYSVITKTQDEMEKQEKINRKRNVTLCEYAEKIRQRLEDNNQYRTADINRCTMKSFMKFRKQQDILLYELDELVVGAYESNLKHQELKIAWRQIMQDIVDRYPSLDGKHLLGILDNHAEKSLQQQRHYQQCLINKTLKKLSKLIDIDITLTMYVARHSWATNAKEKNVPVSVISDSMGHNSEKTTQIYLRSINADQIDQTNDILIKAITK